MADKKRMRRRTRTAQAPVLTNKPKSKPTSFDNIGMSLRCLHCEEIWNGPHKGQKVKRFSTQSQRIEEEAQRKGYLQGGISDGLCGKRSCVDAQVDEDLDHFQRLYPERDFTDLRASMKEEAYAERRKDSDRYPEGLIDDVDPPLGGEP